MSTKIVVRDVYSNMTISFPDVNKAGRWFYDQKIAKNKNNVTSVKNSINKKLIIFKHYLVTEE